jgi:transposase-like protein
MELFSALYIEGRDADEVARVFGMTPNALYSWRSRLRKVIATLKEELDPSGSELERRVEP